MSLLAIAGKELRDLAREKTLLVAVVVQLFVAGFSAFLLVGLQAVSDPGHGGAFPDMRVAYVGPGGFDEHLPGHGVAVRHMEGPQALQAWRDGDFDVVVEEQVADVRTITVLVADGDPVATLHVTRLKGLLQDYEQQLRQQEAGRLETQLLVLEPGPAAKPIAFAYATLLPLLVLVPVFLAGSIAGDAFSQEVQQRTLLLLRSTPARVADIVGGKLIVAVLLAPLQVALWLALYAANGFAVQNTVLLLAFATALALLLAAVGLAIAVWVRNEGQTQAAYAFVAIGLGVASLALPRDPLNTIAWLATGAIDAATWATLAMVAATSIVVTIAAVWSATVAIARDKV